MENSKKNSLGFGVCDSSEASG